MYVVYKVVSKDEAKKLRLIIQGFKKNYIYLEAVTYYECDV